MIEMRQFLLAAVLVVLLQLGDSRPSAHPSLHTNRGPEGRIIGGLDATDGQWPSQLSIEYLGAAGWAHICGAALYKNQYALTAAHCVDATSIDRLRLYAGVLDRRNNAIGQLLTVAYYTIHVNYSAIGEGVPNNLAIIYFVNPADTSRLNIGNAILPPDDTNDFNHGGCFVTGYGRTATSGGVMSDILQWLRLPVITNSECEDRIYNVDHIALYPEQLCVLSDPPGSGPCNGDAGSPLFCYPTENDSSITYLAGLSSWNVANAGTCNLQYPTILTRLSSYLDWIEVHTS